SETSGPRWDLALDLLQRGQAFSLGRVTFRRIDEATVEAAVASAWRQVTEERAREALHEARTWVENLLASDEPFRRTVGESSVEYVLVDDYDTGSVELCRLLGDEVVGLKPPLA
ncbi:MAG TPA: hypothetical protein VF660_01665, partial [Actinomycetota bacterium]